MFKNLGYGDRTMDLRNLFIGPQRGFEISRHVYNEMTMVGSKLFWAGFETRLRGESATVGSQLVAPLQRTYGAALQEAAQILDRRSNGESIDSAGRAKIREGLQVLREIRELRKSATT